MFRFDMSAISSAALPVLMAADQIFNAATYGQNYPYGQSPYSAANYYGLNPTTHHQVPPAPHQMYSGGATTPTMPQHLASPPLPPPGWVAGPSSWMILGLVLLVLFLFAHYMREQQMKQPAEAARRTDYVTVSEVTELVKNMLYERGIPVYTQPQQQQPPAFFHTASASQSQPPQQQQQHA
ncbi:MAG TPA: hypothetical protein VM260_15435 [Pirellula sp.]|nr:hypothetical protein [Pirellula sp.]